MTEAIGAVDTSKVQTKSNKELQALEEKQKNNPFSKFDKNGDGKLEGTEIVALKAALAGMSFEVDSDGSIDESAFEDAFKNAKFEMKD